MSHARPPIPHPSTIPRIPDHRTAIIRTHHGRWRRYQVERLWGVGIPENSLSHHHTLKQAQRAAERWTRQNHQPQPQTIQTYGAP